MDFFFDERLSDSPFVEKIWRTQSDRDGTFTSQAVSNWEMVVWSYEGENHITFRGPETKAVQTDSPANAKFFGIQLKMGTFMPHLPITQLVGSGLTLPEATGKAFWLQNEVWQLPNFDNADTFVNRLMRSGMLVRDPVVEQVLQGQQPELSSRALQYRFLNATGLTQNTVRQIERARQASALLVQGIPILDVVYEAGYYDQAHLTRSLRRFMGQTPMQIARESVAASVPVVTEK